MDALSIIRVELLRFRVKLCIFMRMESDTGLNGIILIPSGMNIFVLLPKWYFLKKTFTNAELKFNAYISFSSSRWYNLTITNPSYDNLGDYLCVAENNGGVMESKVTLTFDDPGNFIDKTSGII